MSARRALLPSRRWLRVGVSAAGVAAGLVALTAAAVGIRSARDTDYRDPSAAITDAFTSGSAGASPVRFRDVAGAVGIDRRHGPGPRSRILPEDMGSGLAWGDPDADGDWDLYVVSFPDPTGAGPPGAGANALYRNDRGTFTDVAAAAGVADPEGFGMGAGFADYDGDGDLDLYVTNWGPNRLFRNRGDGVFDEVAEAAGVADPAWSTGLAWGDVDRDGHLDLYVCNYVVFDGLPMDGGAANGVQGGAKGDGIPFTLNPASFDPAPNRLYLNRGDGTFVDVAEACGVDDPSGRSLGATLCDLDGDGWLDLYVNNDVSTNRLYLNLGVRDGGGGLPAFRDASSVSGTADPRGSMGLSVAELGETCGRSDGLPDLFVTHWIAQENALYLSLLVGGRRLEYRDRSRQLLLGDISIERVGWGCAFVDLDLDGRDDLAVANGSTLEFSGDPERLIPEPLFLFRNDGRRFADVAGTAGEACRRSLVGRGLAAADYDADGDVDLAVSVNRGRPLLLENVTATPNRGLSILLRGPAALVFGARVEVVAGGRSQVRWYGADVSYLSMHAPELVFGLGGDGRADEVRVRWADGRETVRTHVPAGRHEIFRDAGQRR